MQMTMTGIGHRRFDFLFQARGGFEEAGEPVENLRDHTAGFTRFHHARVEAAENFRVLVNRVVKRIAAACTRALIRR